MTVRHHDAEFMRASREVRKRVNAEHKAGRPVWCQRCGREIQPGQRFDVGHRIDAARGGTNDSSNLGPEHRGENRRAGGKLGAQMTNDKRRAVAVAAGSRTTKGRWT